MSDKIHIYRPQRTPAEQLEAIFVAREPLVEQILDRLEHWEPSASRQHYLLIGPRGIGKTCVLQILRHRILQSPSLQKKWRPIALPEEGYRLLRFADVLLEALRVLSQETGDVQVRETLDAVQTDLDDRRVIDLCLDAFRRFHARSGQGIVLMMENVNRILDRQMRRRTETHWLRKILIEEDWLVAICTSPTYVNAVVSPQEPLFEFFQVKLLEELSAAQHEEMLRKLARLEGDTEGQAYLDRFRSRIHALYHFTGGNPRLALMLYDLIVHQRISDVQAELDALLDQLTPFYQDRMKDLGDQEGMLLETMALMQEGCTPTELAAEARLPPKNVRALLMRLERAGYLRRERRRQRRTVYTMPERFFRIWHQMNHSRAARGRVQYLLEFFSTWYASRSERDSTWNALLDELDHDLSVGDDDRVEDLTSYLSYLAAVSEGAEKYRRELESLWPAAQKRGFEAIRERLAELDQQYSQNAGYLIEKGRFLSEGLGRYIDAHRAFEAAARVTPREFVPRFNLGVSLDRLGRQQEARSAFQESAAILLDKREFRDAQKAEEMLLDVMSRDPSPMVVQNAAYILIQLRYREQGGRLLYVLESAREPWRQRCCLNVLGFSKARHAGVKICKFLRDDSPEVREAAAAAIGRLRTREAAPLLLQSLSDDVNNVRGNAAIALGRINAKQAVPNLVSCLNDWASNVRASAALALGLLKAEEATSPLLKCLRDPANNVRGSAAVALGRIGAREAIPALIGYVRSPTRSLRAHAASALGYLGAKEAVRELLFGLADEASAVRGSAATALGRIGTSDAVPALLGCLRDQDSVVRGSAATALGRIRSEQAIPMLIECLRDAVSSVRGSAATALGRIGSEQAIEPLLACLTDHDRGTRISAALALGRIAELRPVPACARIIQTVITSLDSSQWIDSLVLPLLRSAFRSQDLGRVRETIEVVVTQLPDGKALTRPHQLAYMFLQAGRDPAILERQHLEMREAVQMLVDAFTTGGKESFDGEAIAEAAAMRL